MGALRPGIFRLGYEGGGPYLCMAISHGGGTLWEFCGLRQTNSSLKTLLKQTFAYLRCNDKQVDYLWSKHLQGLWASPEQFSAHLKDPRVSSPLDASQTLYPDKQEFQKILKHQQTNMTVGKIMTFQLTMQNKLRPSQCLPRNTGRRVLWALVWSAIWRRHRAASGSQCQSSPSWDELFLSFWSSWFLRLPTGDENVSNLNPRHSTSKW